MLFWQLICVYDNYLAKDLKMNKSYTGKKILGFLLWEDTLNILYRSPLEGMTPIVTVRCIRF